MQQQTRKHQQITHHNQRNAPMIVMGHVADAFGIRGWIRVSPYTETADGLLDYASWWFGESEADETSETGGDWIERQLISGRINGTALDAKLIGCDNRDQALQLKGLKIAVPRERLPDLPDDGEAGYYWADLVGTEVVNLDGIKLGTVTGLFETGANDVLRVQSIAPDTKELLIPFVEATVIKKVDLKRRNILVDWESDY